MVSDLHRSSRALGTSWYQKLGYFSSCDLQSYVYIHQMMKDVVLGAVMAGICINIQTMLGFEPNQKSRTWLQPILYR